MARVCAEPGCPTLIEAKRRRPYCDAHQRERHRLYDQRRGSRHARGYTNKWDKAAKAFLKAHPWCAHCEQQGRKVPATEVDHIEPHKDDKRKFWNRRNWQALCKGCHSRKTLAETRGEPVTLKGSDEQGEPLDTSRYSPWFEKWGET